MFCPHSISECSYLALGLTGVSVVVPCKRGRQRHCNCNVINNGHLSLPCTCSRRVWDRRSRRQRITRARCRSRLSRESEKWRWTTRCLGNSTWLVFPRHKGESDRYNLAMFSPSSERVIVVIQEWLEQRYWNFGAPHGSRLNVYPITPKVEVQETEALRLTSSHQQHQREA